MQRAGDERLVAAAGEDDHRDLVDAFVEAVQRQIARGTHYGACHTLEVEWAEWITRLIPSAELVRFTMSGTEATHLAMRVARAYTGRPKILKLAGHFHGWHDGAVAAVNPPYDVPWSAGVPAATIDQVVTVPANDIKAVEVALGRGDIAAVILEPVQGEGGVFPAAPGYLEEAQRIAHDAGALFIESHGTSTTATGSSPVSGSGPPNAARSWSANSSRLSVCWQRSGARFAPGRQRFPSPSEPTSRRRTGSRRRHPLPIPP